MNRRAILKGFSAAGLGFAAGATIWRVQSNHVLRTGGGPAYAPWTEWQQAESTPLERLVRAAVLAANPHNTQPWKFHLMPDGIRVHADTSRNIGDMDPLLREMHIGVGCALENLLLAAEAAGYRWSFDKLDSSGDEKLQPIVGVLLKEDTKRVSDLYTAIPKRHTNRGPYLATKDVDEHAIKALDALKNSDSELQVFWFRKPEERRAFGDLVVRATEAIIADPGQSTSSAHWMRANWKDIERFRDGVTLDSQGLSPVFRALAKFLPPLSIKQTDRFWLSATIETHVATASAFGMIAVLDARNIQQRVETGRLWQRMHLFATLHGVAMHPLNQPVERRDRELHLGHSPDFAKALWELQQDDRWQAVMPFRLGYPEKDALPSPRRAIASVLI